MSGHKPWSQIKRKLPHDLERERRQEEYSRAYDVVRPVVALSERAAGRAVPPEELARVLDDPDAGDAAAVLGRLARHAEELGGTVELRLVFPDLPEDDVAAVRLRPSPEPAPDPQ